MVERRRLNRVEGPANKKRPVGKRKVGRPAGSESEFKRVARARAQMSGGLPDEILLRWGREGRMEYPNAGPKVRARTVELEPADRIACLKSCMAFYKAPYQSRPMPGEQAPTVRLEIDPKALRAMAAKSPDKLDVFRDVLRAIQAAGGDVSGIAAVAEAPRGDPSRYAKMLSESSATDGSA